MKILKGIGLVFLVVLVIYLVLCLMGTKNFKTSRSMTMKATPQNIYEEINDYKKWATWGAWAKRDPKMTNKYFGNAGTVGHKNEWVSKQEGSGSQEMVEVRANEYIKHSLKFVDWDGETFSEMILTPKGDSTQLTWTLDGSDIPFMARGIVLLMGGASSINKDYDEGLASLKKIVESKPASLALQYEVVDITEIIFIGKRMKLNEKQIDSALFANTYTELAKVAGGMDKIAGMPFSIGHSYDEKTGDIDLEIGFPVAKEMKVPTGLTFGKIPAGKCAKYIYHGAYEKTAEVWMPFTKMVNAKFKTRYDGYEVYANDPTTVKSKEELITWLMIPVE